MKALQIILNYFVLIVISAPFISKVLQTTSRGIFWELEPSPWF